MNNTVKKVMLLLVCMSFVPQINAQEPSTISKDSLISIVNEYYKINIKIFKANSTKEDIDDVFKLFTEDFVYIHPKYGGPYTRQKLYDGYIRNQKNGGYDGSVVDIKVVNMITGLNAVAVERKYVTKTENGNQDGEYQMTLFEFADGKISEIFEYW